MKDEFIPQKYCYVDSSDTTIKIFIDNTITYPAIYRDVFSTLLNAKEYETAHIYVNSLGGRVDSAIEIVSAIKHSKAKTIGHIITAISAGSLIVLACDKIAVHSYATMMIHQISYGQFATVSKHKQRTEFESEYMTELFKDIYSWFLTEDEINDVLTNDKELYFMADDIKARIPNNKFYEL